MANWQNKINANSPTNTLPVSNVRINLFFKRLINGKYYEKKIYVFIYTEVLSSDQ